MNFEVSGKEREVNFGIGFVRELDKKFTVKQSGVEFGMGLQQVVPQLRLKSPVILVEVLKAGIKNVSEKQIDNAVEKYAEENDGLDDLFEEVTEGLKASAITRASVKQMEQRMEEAND